MKNALMISCLLLTACGDSKTAGTNGNDGAYLVCSENADCNCENGDGTCGADGMCYCPQVIEVNAGCEHEADCVDICPEAETLFCSPASGTCRCTYHRIELVEVTTPCQYNSDCSCETGNAECGEDGMCYCNPDFGFCGDTVIAGLEECDTYGAACAELGSNWTGTVATCRDDCIYDTTDCICTPNCNGEVCGADDGCGGICIDTPNQITGEVRITVIDAFDNPFTLASYDVLYDGEIVLTDQGGNATLTSMPTGMYTIDAHTVTVGSENYEPTVVLTSAIGDLAQGGIVEYQVVYTKACYNTFNDVPCSAWYFDYVEQLVDEGVFDVSDNFRPADFLNRAEMVKLVITAIDGLAGYQTPPTPTFDDVPANAWFYDYVEAAVQLGIVSGYTDPSGNLTGLFGPGDNVNRAAGIKWVVNSFAVPTTLSPASPFSDVTPSNWFHDYVLTAYNQSVVDGYSDGRFAPADLVTRAKIAKWLVNAQSPVQRP